MSNCALKLSVWSEKKHIESQKQGSCGAEHFALRTAPGHPSLQDCLSKRFLEFSHTGTQSLLQAGSKRTWLLPSWWRSLVSSVCHWFFRPPRCKNLGLCKFHIDFKGRPLTGLEPERDTVYRCESEASSKTPGRCRCQELNVYQGKLYSVSSAAQERGWLACK